MKKFSTSISGYNKNEVNAFVSDVTKEYESMLNKLKLQDKEISELKEKLVRYQNMESTLNKAIMLAEESGSQIKRMARDEGRGIIEDAKRNASRIVNDALIKAQKLENIFIQKKISNHFRNRIRSSKEYRWRYVNLHFFNDKLKWDSNRFNCRKINKIDLNNQFYYCLKYDILFLESD